MKKIILGLSVICFHSVAAAQVRFGVKAGYNLSTLIYSGTISLNGEKPKSGFNAGVYATIPLSEIFSLVPECVYSVQGTSFQDGSTSGKLNYDYLNVPVLIRYTLRTGIFFETGLQVGILLTANEKTNAYTTDIMYKTYGRDFAWPMGLGYQIPDQHFGVDLRYNLGLVNILKSGSDVNVKNSVFQFGVFYEF